MWDSINNGSCDVCYKSRKTCNTVHTTNAFLDKENLQSLISPIKNDDISLYENTSPRIPSCISPCSHGTRRPLEDHDSNSQDSGYGAGYINENGKFMSYASPSRGVFRSFGSACSMEDDYLEDFSDVEPLDKNNLPNGFEKLIDGPLIHRPKLEEKSSPKDAVIRPLFRRALSLQNTRITPKSRARTSLFKTGGFKRPEPPCETETVVTKKSKFFDEIDDDFVPSVPEATRPTLVRAFSATEESIMSAVQRSSTETDLIGDFSKNFCLPLINGKHQDLKAITATTLVRLMKGEYEDTVASFKVIDCRYPYEFEGGHIDGAINLYTKDQCNGLLNTPVPADDQKRHILVFHCEFSSERGPNLYRHLRKEDRQKNVSDYPALNYPEVYLLEGGYKLFFEQYSEMCVPIAYKEMLHPDHESDLRHFRQKSKTWNIDTRQRTQYNRLRRLM